MLRASGRGPQARRNGYFHRLLDNQYGRIPELTWQLFSWPRAPNLPLEISSLAIREN